METQGDVCKIDVIKMPQNSQENTYVGVFFNKVASL